MVPYVLVAVMGMLALLFVLAVVFATMSSLLVFILDGPGSGLLSVLGGGVI